MKGIIICISFFMIITTNQLFAQNRPLMDRFEETIGASMDLLDEIIANLQATKNAGKPNRGTELGI